LAGWKYRIGIGGRQCLGNPQITIVRNMERDKPVSSIFNPCRWTMLNKGTPLLNGHGQSSPHTAPKANLQKNLCPPPVHRRKLRLENAVGWGHRGYTVKRASGGF